MTISNINNKMYQIKNVNINSTMAIFKNFILIKVITRMDNNLIAIPPKLNIRKTLFDFVNEY